MTTADAFPALRERLQFERDALLRELDASDHLAPGFLNLLGAIQSSLCAISAASAQDDLPHGAASGRLVVTDQPDLPLTVTVYPVAGAPVAVQVSPQWALAVAADLTEAARRRMTGGEA